MNNNQIASLFREIAAAYGIKDEKKFYFQMLAYQKAADAIEQSTSEAKDLYDEGKLEELPGIGKTIALRLEELFKTGKVKHFAEIKKGIPEGVFPLLQVPKIGPKTAFKLVTILKLKNPQTVIYDLEKGAKLGKIAKIPTFGTKSQEEILNALAQYREGRTKSARMVLPFAYEIAGKVIDYMKKCKAVKQIETLGSLRRMVATIGDIDLAVASHNPKEVISWFGKYPYKERIIEAGPETSSFLTSGGKQVDLMVQPPEGFGALLQHFTGSKEHNIRLRTYALSKGLSLSEHGIKKGLKSYQIPTEEEFYETIGMQWIPPEMREDKGEIELAVKRELPKLVELKDIKGDLHTHSSFNIEPSHDLGGNSIPEMAQKAKSLGYEYLGLAEHNPSITNHTPEQNYHLILKRNNEIDRVEKTEKVHLFKLLEIDILADGQLALDEKSLSLLDGAIASVHSSFTQPKAKITERILKSLSHPKVRILGHPTGRLLNQRESLDADWPQIFKFCKEHNKALEINAWPNRLDLPDTLVRQALKAGVKIIIDTDSHAMDQLAVMKFGVAVARRGWATAKDIVNTQSYEKFRQWLLYNQV
ncbi:DNA polymerase III [Candidatus Gottesmanbacteria bacterium]|nr:DNA polymerase III [Candidatus Gottesmanbacteria bacterium]